jgi:predicted RND superfamily exporter protein
MKKMRNPINVYARFVSRRPYLVIVVSLIILVISTIPAANVKIESQDQSEYLPKGTPIIEAFDLLEASFGSQSTMLISIEIDPEYTGSDEVRDIRVPSAMRYVDLLSEGAAQTRRVVTVSSASLLLKESNGGVLPQTEREIVSLTDQNPLFFRVISDDYSMTLIRMGLEDVGTGEKVKELVDSLQEMIDTLPRPPGLSVNVAGDLAVNPAVDQTLGPDIGRTSQLSFLGIIIVLLLLFGSVRYGIMPLSVIIIGIAWAFGFMGATGISLNNATSGIISMIMGIGIDFGIQVTSRFRQELNGLPPQQAMENTMNNVFVPMATTTLAALIGFRAMGAGNLTFMGEFGFIMSLGIAFTFLAAITFVPAILVVSDDLCKRFSRACRAPLRLARRLARKATRR